MQVQSFLSQACFPACQGLTTITGLPARHLDSWLMSPETCRQIFVRGAQGADLALVQGEYESAVSSGDTGGRLETLCRWLNLPRLVVVDADRVEAELRHGVLTITLPKAESARPRKIRVASAS